MAELFLAATAVWTAMVAWTLRLVTQKVPEYVMVCAFIVACLDS